MERGMEGEEGNEGKGGRGREREGGGGGERHEEREQERESLSFMRHAVAQKSRPARKFRRRGKCNRRVEFQNVLLGLQEGCQGFGLHV